jgi:hypothetical protein
MYRIIVMSEMDNPCDNCKSFVGGCANDCVTVRRCSAYKPILPGVSLESVFAQPKPLAVGDKLLWDNREHCICSFEGSGTGCYIVDMTLKVVWANGLQRADIPQALTKREITCLVHERFADTFRINPDDSTIPLTEIYGERRGVGVGDYLLGDSGVVYRIRKYRDQDVITLTQEHGVGAVYDYRVCVSDKGNLTRKDLFAIGVSSLDAYRLLTPAEAFAIMAENNTTNAE